MMIEDLGYNWTSLAAKEFFDQIQSEITAIADRTFGHRQMSPVEYAEAKLRFEDEVAMLRKKAASLVGWHTVPKPIVIKK